MNQHSIQEAYLKNFSKNGKLKVYDKESKKNYYKSPSQCTTETNFQSEYLEAFQNTTIESPGVKALKKLIDGNEINSDEFNIIRYWTALHSIRNKRYRDMLNTKYESSFEELIELEKKVSMYFRFLHMYTADQGKYFLAFCKFRIDCLRLGNSSPTPSANSSEI